LLFGGLNCGAVVEVWEFWRVLVTWRAISLDGCSNRDFWQTWLGGAG
jgi:hypothetical protein